ncbi:non-ribosomal peptide synthetase [Calothrix sp. CCY 0018]|uniref:non-ribosomal peptide synthetase n=1 Tax=Calothrix sp. CCY 0018 TaxID=3103864 RepID=UPI0039C75DEA
MNHPPLIQDWFSQTAEKFGNNTAVNCGEQKLTYSEIEAQSNKLANFLIEHGATKGSIVAILAEDTIKFIIAILGILKAGCVFVPLVPNLPEHRINTIVAEVSPKWFVVDAVGFKKISHGRTVEFSQSPVICLSETQTFENFNSFDYHLNDYAEYSKVEKPFVQLEPDDMCYLYFTSGSTGKPKGIAGRLKSISHFINWEIKTFNIKESIRVSQLITPAFDAFLRDIFVPLCSGGVVCIPEEIDTILDARKLISFLDNQQINLIHCVPSLFRSILNQDLDKNQFCALQYILLSGEPLQQNDISRWMDVYGDRIQLVNLYGASETTMTKFFYFVKPEDTKRQSIPIGKPMDGAAAIVVDSQGKVCPSGMVGEIYIRTPYRTLGYYQQPELTSKVFIANPFSNNKNDIIYKTGDLGRILEDGNFECLGRKDRQVKIRGIRIELGEIENHLRSHRSVKDIAIVDRDDSNGNKYLCAYVVLFEKLPPGELKDFLLEFLPESMIPSVFVVMDALPRTISGKIDRRSLPAPNRQQNRTFVPPKTPVEVQLAQIWMQVLNIDRVGLNDNFFELGGHSLNATQLVSRVGKAFGVEMPLRILFESPILASLVESLETLRWAKEQPQGKQHQLQGTLEEGEL